MTPDDILNLLKLVCPPSPVVSLSAPTRHIVEDLITVRPRTSPPLKTHKSTPWKRRPSAVAASIQDRDDVLDMISSTTEDHQQEEDEDEQDKFQPDLIMSGNTSIEVPDDSPGEKEEHSKLITTEEEEDEYSNQDLARYYRRSLKLTQRLKSSEKSLASMARDNEDRIVQLQNKVDDMNMEVAKQRREIQEYKGKEKSSLDQISALEAHISNIQRSETDQKQVYLSIKSLFDEKCREAQELQELLRQKECDLEKTEDLLNSFQYEVQLLSQERSRLIGLQNNLEMELQTSAQAHKQLEEQKSENEKLKEIIDTLKTDLDEALHQQSSSSSAGEVLSCELVDDTIVMPHHPSNIRQPSIISVSSSINEESHASLKTLESEFTDLDQLKSVRDEKDYYKNRANEAKEDLDRVKSELDYLRRALDSENRSLVNELAELRLKTNTVIVPPLSPSSSSTTTTGLATKPILDSISLTIPEPPIMDVWSHSRIRKVNKKKRTVQDLHESTSSMNSFVITTSSQHSHANNRDRKVMTRRDDKIVTNTVTFALYTVLIYFFGIVTSTFLLDGATGQNGWEQALVAAASGQVPKSKVLEIILYWIEKLLFEPQGLPVS
ncbi:putative DNA helicase ino80 [Mucor velutinosus]|uniref:DNA helicase ino80 n=1 Tax=Mucor velutinosus TaxID=708070 RepID=A0AAN7DPI4_9FUNG|nr:putative DNA helicase ino80 [Mucor velutinosus]